MKRTAFYVSDSTGITAHTLGQSLLAQFEGLQIEHVIVPYVDTEDKIRDVVAKINATGSSRWCSTPSSTSASARR
jgi:regulator of PEP synthase PpsR (kinase-PPPase family)